MSDPKWPEQIVMPNGSLTPEGVRDDGEPVPIQIYRLSPENVTEASGTGRKTVMVCSAEELLLAFAEYLDVLFPAGQNTPILAEHFIDQEMRDRIPGFLSEFGKHLSTAK